jgi:phenylacetate-CoA ligase
VTVRDLYQRLPVQLQHAACSLRGWQIQRTHYGPPFSELLEQAERRMAWSAEEIDAYRDRRLREFVRHAAHTVPFYRSHFRELGLAPEQITTLDDLRVLPVLTKAEVQERDDELLSEAVSKRDRFTRHTSGTTGAGLRFASTLRALQEQEAAHWRFRRWHGIQRGTWCAYFSALVIVPQRQQVPPFWRYNQPGRQILFSTLHMSAATLGAYVAELRRRRPPWLHGYPSALALLAGHIVDTDAELGYEPRWVTTGAEMLLPQQKALIERALGVRPLQRYAMAEAVAGASECERGMLHVDEDFAAVELLPNPNGAGARVVGTNFTNIATPLVRYELMDVVTLSDRACPCGRPGRTLAAIEGRSDDYVVTANGALISRLGPIFWGSNNVREAQIRQERPGEVTVRIVRGPNYSRTDEDNIRLEAEARLGERTLVSFEYHERLPRSASGKLRTIVSEVPAGKIDALRGSAPVKPRDDQARLS